VLDRYHALQIKVQRPFSRGFSFLAGYSYKREKSSVFFNAIDQYANYFTFQDVGPAAAPNSTASPNLRHRFNAAGTYELPFGHNRPYLSHIPRILDAALGGWSLSAELFMNSGTFIQFGQMIANGNPVLSNPTRDKWFDTSVFQKAAAYTPRTNPWMYPGLTGPGSFDIDSTLSKSFRITERFRLEFRLEAYNLTNTIMWSGPNVDVNSSLFGRITSQANVCREVQYAARLHF
jgi:trimeric autotransporter adhesin